MQAHVDWWLGQDRGPAPERVALIVVTGDDESAVSTLPSDYSQRWRTATLSAESATARVAAHLGVPLLLADDTEIPDVDLLLLAGAGRGLTTAAAVVACHSFGAEPQLATGYGSGIDDLAWMDKVRDVRSRFDQSSAPLAAMAEILETAADAQVPVVLDGVDTAAAASLAGRLPDVHVPAISDEPAHKFLVDRLDCPVWDVSSLPPGAGLSALGALSSLRLGLLAAERS